MLNNEYKRVRSLASEAKGSTPAERTTSKTPLFHKGVFLLQMPSDRMNLGTFVLFCVQRRFRLLKLMRPSSYESILDFVSHRPITTLTLVPHPQQCGVTGIYKVDHLYIRFCGVLPV